MGRPLLNLLCSVPDCGTKRVANGMCYIHYMRMKRTGITGLRPRGIRVRLMKHRVITAMGCWEWMSGTSSHGYGHLEVRRNGKIFFVAAHRASYREFKGPIPDGLEIDHICENRLCINPAHLEAVTHSENMRRAWARKKARQQLELT